MEFFLKQVYPWLSEVSLYSVLVPFVTGLIFFKKLKSPQFRYLFLFVSIWLVSEATGEITVLLGTNNNLWSIHVFNPLQFSAIALVFYYTFESRLSKRLIVLAIAFVVIVTLNEAFMLDGIEQMNSVSKIFSNTLLIAMTLAYFYKVANKPKTLYLDQDPIFLLSASLLIYIAGTSMSWALFNDALEVSYDAARICLSIVFVLNVLFNSWQAFILRKMAA
ncbi:hypothetical protein H9Q13_07760 [Pontibacter sp. JH31]|uniref:Histidine kinase N-terminal 7TM region domain-containing protein n=1 Tax=Pontibacter aquaedesilientis TaxID=2766980 RepID=A0ABR7XFJ1_9BACT|nr:hypothetical protein [Pontibacter aquaedesilientis]MBD1397058.1 hypothetical protein [Pontibacter aquaedesilientis]